MYDNGVPIPQLNVVGIISEESTFK